MIRFRMACLLFVVACGAGEEHEKRVAPARGEVTISVLAISDLHGRIEQLPLFAGYVNNVRAARMRDHGATLVLDAGDMFQGTLESNLGEGAAVVAAYDVLGMHAAAIGNHEFDFGPVGEHMVPHVSVEDPLGALKARMAQARFPMLSVNLKARAGRGVLLPRLTPSVMLWAAGMRVGVIGGITANALTLTQPANVRDLLVAPLAQSIATEAAALRARGASAVIALVHAGGECKRGSGPDDLASCVHDSELFELARKLPPRAVDLIIGGHTHEYVAHRVAGIAVIESGANGHAFGRVDLRVDRATRRVLEAKIHPTRSLCAETLRSAPCTQEPYEGAPVKRDGRVIQAIAPDIAHAERVGSASLGVEIVRPVARASATESPLSNLVADLMLQSFPDADVAFNNGGAVRVSLTRGPLTYGQVFEAFPFDNTFATLPLTAAALAKIVARNLQGEHGILALSGVRARAHCRHGALSVELLRPDGRVIAPDTRLQVVTSDFLASQGDGLLRGTGLREGDVVMHRERLIRDELVAALRAFPGGRIDGNDKRFFDPAHPRIAYSGGRPLRCP